MARGLLVGEGAEGPWKKGDLAEPEALWDPSGTWGGVSLGGDF